MKLLALSDRAPPARVTCRRWGTLTALGQWLALVSSLATAACWAQTPAADSIHPPVDRRLSRGIERAEASIAAGEYSQAIAFLDEVLGREDDFFVEKGQEGALIGLKDAARRLIRELPPDGRAAYVAAYGPAAKRMCEAAIKSGDAAALQKVVERYFDTPAGYQAALALAREESDAGRRLSAALLYQQLLDTPEAAAVYNPQLAIEAAASWQAAGDEKKAAAAIATLAKGGKQPASIGGRKVVVDADLADVDAARAWLDDHLEPVESLGAPLERQWVTYRGNAARNGESNGGLPHMRVRWKARLIGFSKLARVFEDFASDMRESGKPAPAAGVPLAVGETILVQTPQHLLAVDFRTGKMIWRTEPQREAQIEQLISASGAADGSGDPGAAQAFARRVWDDHLYHSIASDGKRVFTIRDLDMAAMPLFEPWQAPFGGADRDGNGDANRLCAYDLATQGKLVWEIDGAGVEGPLRGAFFLGAPVAVGETLYALAEVKHRIYLVALDAATGGVQWLQQLVDVEVRVTANQRRRMQASMPSYESGMLVCPTGAGIVVGVDASRRSLAWAYRYATNDASPQTIYDGSAQMAEVGPASRWVDAGATIVDGRVLVTPPESNEVHCLDLRSGKLLWRKPRGEAFQLACVDDGRVLFVGPHSITARRLSDGDGAWKKALAFESDAQPAGSGFLSDGQFYLPLSSGEVLAVETATGKVTAEVASRDASPLGNLICHRGAIVSASGMYLDRFDQIDVLRRRAARLIAANPDDPEALRMMGEVAYNDGRLSEAVDLLERSYRKDSVSVATREMLAECLASAIEEDFAAYRQRLPLLRELNGESEASRTEFLRIESEGLLKAGEPLAAAEACLAMFERFRRPDEPLAIGQHLDTTVARWTAAQLRAIWDAADDATRGTLLVRLAQVVASFGEVPQGEQLGRLVELVGDLPHFESLKLARARELGAAGQNAAGQQLLLDLAKSDDDTIRAEAVARLAKQLHDAGLIALGSEFVDQLAGPLADVTCLDGEAGAQLAEKWREDLNQDPANWPSGKVVWNMGPSVSAASDPTRIRQQMWGVRWERCDSVLGGAAALQSQRGNDLAITDARGREFFRSATDMQQPYRQPGSMYAVSRGNVAVVSFGRQLVAVSTLPLPEGVNQPVLWRVNLGNSLDYSRPFPEETAPSAAARPGTLRAPRASAGGRWVGVIGPLTSRGCVFQDQRRLSCVDPITGAVAWTRDDVLPGCDLWGDEQVVLAAPLGSKQARVYSMLDGRSLGEFSTPPWREQVTTIGRTVVRWRSIEDGKMELACFDPLADEHVRWRHEFAPNSRVDVDQQRYIAVASPEGQAYIIDAETGEKLVDAAIDAAPRFEEIHLTASSGDFLLAIKRPDMATNDRMVRPITVIDSPVIDGQLYLFDRSTGQLAWNQPASVVQQALPVNQPVDSPLIMFAGMLATQGRNGTRSAVSMLVLDKRTGRTLFQSDDLSLQATQCMVRVTDPDKHEAAIEIGSRAINFRYTDERRPPQPPATAEVETPSGASSGGLMGIFRKLGQGQ